MDGCSFDARDANSSGSSRYMRLHANSIDELTGVDQYVVWHSEESLEGKRAIQACLGIVPAQHYAASPLLPLN